MRHAYGVAQVRAAEQALMATVPDGALMQRAAAGLAVRAASLLADRGVYSSRVLLLVGAGNNGGDTLFAGARLARRGAQVRALLLGGDHTHAAGLADFRAAGGRLVDSVAGPVDLVLDGIVGIGGRPGLRPDALAAVRAVAETGAPVLAVDVPSGVDVDTGAAPAESVCADVTVTFGTYKPCLVVGPAAPRAGLVELIDIGLGPYLPAQLEPPAGPVLSVPDAGDIGADWPVPGPLSDKYTRGVVGVATGSEAYSGAAVLSVGGALLGPAGFVRYAGHAADFVRRAWPSAVISDRVGDAGRVQAWVVGSGLGTDVRAKGELRAALAADVPVCVDADGLTLLAEDPAGWLGDRAAPTVLTPHDREFARLSGAEPGDDRPAAARALAARLGVIVLLKGDRTVVATPDGRCLVNSTGTAALATAGSGDVLSGLLGSLLAAGLPADRAAIAAAFAHGLAGREAAGHGPVTAMHVLSALRPVVRSLTSGNGRTNTFR
ncbi:bifunctional NAD(P)H-hydrate repair enzyme [Actinocatenispora thailandica]|uniref:Bifunctional NAD(P)H-hydrate repair enzyme n=1 Tax=Actinocatenispora thailandica TaxID=227318 RepID=A0A7R7HZS1_9ACTN|nr:NAD(P)H-hydrate dehydratase [Actinocatenispora thailandica]BCJ37821.1 bifunctional NAD(P)H-hydrate repair enzyme [Actinocatenispora thailandica]